jgi:hypothetical protein
MQICVEPGLENENPKICIHCCVVHHPNTVLFVDLPPDDFGPRSLAKSIHQVYHKDNGDWHKHGAWHDQRITLARQQ